MGAVLLRGVDAFDKTPTADKPIATRKSLMTERWFIVARKGGQRYLLDSASASGAFVCTSAPIEARLTEFLDWPAAYQSLERARLDLEKIQQRASELAQSARIVRVRKWAKGERAKAACDWAGIPTIENGKPISTGRRVELLAERAMAFGATMHEQRAELYTLRAAAGKPAVKLTKRGDRS